MGAEIRKEEVCLRAAKGEGAVVDLAWRCCCGAYGMGWRRWEIEICGKGGGDGGVETLIAKEKGCEGFED